MNKLNLGNDLYLKGRIGWRGLNKQEYLENSDYKIINATSLIDGYIDWDNCGYISKERYEESKEIQLKENDILISKDGTLGKIGYVKNMKGYCTVASGIFVLRNKIPDKLNFDYLYHILKSNIFKDFIRRNKADGSTINHLYQRDLENFEIDLPPIEVQNKIAGILNNIENKIELNKTIDKNLDNVSECVFNYWFRQFSFPGNNNKYSNEIIPNDWKKTKIINSGLYVSDYTANGSFKSLADNVIYNDGDPYSLLVRIVDFNNDFSDKNLIYVNKHAYDFLNKSNLHGNEIIICNVGNAGAVYRCPKLNIPMTLGPNGIVLKSELLNNYLYFYFKSNIGQQQLLSISSGSIQKKFNKTNFRDLDIILPSEEILNKFNDFYNPILEKKNNIWLENRKLNSFKQFILPMLLNGQVKMEE